MKVTVGLPGMIAVTLGYAALAPREPLSLIDSALLHTVYFGATALTWGAILFLCMPRARK
jgi:hypothetical protein